MSYIFRPPVSKKELNIYLETYTGVKFSENIVDPESTYSQLDAIWEVYETMLTNKKGPKNFVAVVSRNGCKTLMGSILAFLSLVIFRRNVVIMSATKAQSEAMINYMDQHFRKSKEISKYCKTDNRTSKEVMDLPPNTYTKTINYAKCVVVAATMKGANSQRASLLLLDELDLVDPKIIAEVSGVLDPTRDEHSFQPVTVALSSRKAAKGPIQTAIDKSSEQPELWNLLKWSVTDLLEPCAYKEENNKEEGKPALISQEDLSIKYDTTLEDISEIERENWKQRTYYSKCKECKNGRGFLMCQGLTMNAIDNDSKARRSLDFLLNVATAVDDVSVLVAQYLNWKPENKGAVFRSFNHIKHTGTLEQIYRWAMSLHDGLKVPKDVNWYFLANTLQKNGFYLVAGIDYGYLPDPATLVILAHNPDNRKTVVLKTMYRNEFSNQDWSNFCIAYCKKHGLKIDLFAPDHADGAAKSYFSRHGLPVTPKKPAKIITGVSQIRGLLLHPVTQTVSFKILHHDDKDYTRYIKEISTWLHAQNSITKEWDQEKFEKGNDHGIDATRYALDTFNKECDRGHVEIDSSPEEDMSDLKDYINDLEKTGNVTHEQQTTMLHKALEQQHGVVIDTEEDDDEGDNECFFMF